jgi:hypothetical protein
MKKWIFVLMIPLQAVFARTECDVARERVIAWKGQDFDWKNAALNPGEVDKALAMIDAMKFPTANEIDAAEKAMEKDIRLLNAYSQRVTASDCVDARQKLMTGLIATASTNASAKAKIQTAILSILKKPKFSTYLTARADAELLQFAVDRHLWTVDADHMKKLVDLRSEIKNEIHNAQVGSSDLWRKFDNRKYASAPMEDLNRLKPFVFEEISASRRFMKGTEEILNSHQ